MKSVKRGATFNELAEALGITSSALRRWARRDRVHGANLVRGKWLLFGPLTPKRVEMIKMGLKLTPNISKGRLGLLPKPERKKRIRAKSVRLREINQKIKAARERWETLKLQDSNPRGGMADLGAGNASLINIKRIQQGALIRMERERRGRILQNLEIQKLKILHGRRYKESDAFLELSTIHWIERWMK